MLALTKQLPIPGRLLRLRPDCFGATNEMIVKLMVAAGMPGATAGQGNPIYPPQARWCELLRHLRIAYDTVGWTEDVTVMLGGQTQAARYADVAAVFNVSIATVKQWAASGMPKDGPPYDLCEILNWRLMADERADINQRRTH